MHADAAQGESLSAHLRVDGIVWASLLPLAWKAVDYALIGGFLPLVALLLGGALALTAWRTRRARVRRASIRVWAWLLMLWSAARLVVFALHLAMGIPDPHVAHQLDAFYLTVSVAYLGAALWLLMAVRATEGNSQT